MFIKFPDEESWNNLQKHSLIKSFILLLDKLQSDTFPNSIEEFRDIHIQELIHQLHFRFIHLDKGLLLMHFYYEDGINDVPWLGSVIKDGRERQVYFPKLDKQDRYRKDWFDFYSDIFYTKYFSALDILAHLIKHVYRLNFTGNEKVSFHLVTKKLNGIDGSLYETLNTFRGTSSFDKANNELRNNLTHNYHPRTVGMKITEEKEEDYVGWTLGNRNDFVPANEIMENAKSILDQLLEVIEFTTDSITKKLAEMRLTE